jgi:mono/diheme cytochrome c family protein
LLYTRHCSGCHGPNGDGLGPAARHLFPRPRDLRSEPMRLVSAENGVPTPEDLRSIIRAGIPGTSMVPLETLAPQELDLLVECTLQLRRDGLRAQYAAQLPPEEEPSETELAHLVALRTTPGKTVQVPQLPTADPARRSLGNTLYVQQACVSCHGEDGTGDRNMPLFDVAGRPDFPRDLAHDRFKGGNRPADIYLRILLGMPGTPHPANVAMTVPELIALTQYTASLGQEPKQAQTNHQRAIQASRRPAVPWGD